MKTIFLPVGWRCDEEGRAEEEEVMSRKRKAEEEIERNPGWSMLACFNFGSFGNPSEGGDVVRVVQRGGVRDGAGEWECWSDVEESESVPVLVSVLTSVSASVSVCRTLVPQTFSFLRKRSARGADQESENRNRPTTQRTPSGS